MQKLRTHPIFNFFWLKASPAPKAHACNAFATCRGTRRHALANVCSPASPLGWWSTAPQRLAPKAPPPQRLQKHCLERGWLIPLLLIFNRNSCVFFWVNYVSSSLGVNLAYNYLSSVSIAGVANFTPTMSFPLIFYYRIFFLVHLLLVNLLCLKLSDPSGYFAFHLGGGVWLLIMIGIIMSHSFCFT